MKLINPFFDQGYHLYVDNFYTSVTLFKDLFALGVPNTGTILESKRDFLLVISDVYFVKMFCINYAN